MRGGELVIRDNRIVFCCGEGLKGGFCFEGHKGAGLVGF